MRTTRRKYNRNDGLLNYNPEVFPDRSREQRLGFYLEILHSDPEGNAYRTLAHWPFHGPVNQESLNDWVEDYRNLLRGKRSDVAEILGYHPIPYRVNLRQQLCPGGEILFSWSDSHPPPIPISAIREMPFLCPES